VLAFLGLFFNSFEEKSEKSRGVVSYIGEDFVYLRCGIIKL